MIEIFLWLFSLIRRRRSGGNAVNITGNNNKITQSNISIKNSENIRIVHIDSSSKEKD